MKRIFLLFLLIIAISKVYSTQVLSVIDNKTSYFRKDSLELLNIVTSEDFFKKVLNTKDGDTFVKQELNSNRKGLRHELYEQYYHGIKVEGCGYVLHFNNDSLVSAHGNYFPIEDLRTIPSISESAAIEVFAKYEGIPSSIVSDYRCSLSILPSKDTVKNKLPVKLVYSVSIPFAKEMGLIDAHTGEILFVCPAMQDFSSTATFSTLYSGTQQSTTHYYGGAYHLVDSTRNAVIHTWDLQNSLFFSNRTELSDNDNIWTYNEHASNNHYIALDIQWGFQKVYDFLYNKYNRNSYDDNGSDITAYINYSGVDNAYWTSSAQSFCFTNSYNAFNPLVSIDVIAHEFGHGISYAKIGWGNTGFEYTLTDNQKAEKQGCDEGLSDIWAIIVESDVKGASGRWKMAEECTKGNTSCLRNIANPSDNSAYTQIADTYNTGLYSSTDPHVRGGVFSRWFYLLVNGGSGVNGLGNSYQVTGIGLDAAESIIVNAIFEGYLYHTKSFSEIRSAFTYYALDNGYFDYSQQMEKAWYAVGVGSNPGSYDFTIAGQAYIYDAPCIYSLSSLPSTMSVNWSLTGDNASNFVLESNTPATNQCRITRISDAEFDGYTNLTLSAQIMNGSTTIYTTSMQLTAPYIVGPTIPCGHTVYYVDPLPDNYTVEWAASGRNLGYDTDPNGLLPGYPYAYVIIHEDNEVHQGTLTATIKNGNTIKGTLQKNVDTTDGFSGTWYQQATLTDTVNSTPSPFRHNSFLTFIPHRKVYLQSEHFVGASITHTQSNLLLGNWSHNGSTISFTPHQVTSSPSTMRIIGTDFSGCKRFQLNLSTPVVIPPILLSMRASGNFYEFTLSQEDDSEQAKREAPAEWHLTIMKIDTGKRYLDEKVRATTKGVNTSGWPSGIYAAVAQLDDMTYSLKFSIAE